jgi:hypothetical protein
MKRWQLTVLVCELALFACILILPQVALPDFTVHDRTSPNTIQARLSSSPLRTAIELVSKPAFAGGSAENLWGYILDVSPTSVSSSRLSLFCPLIC